MKKEGQAATHTFIDPKHPQSDPLNGKQTGGLFGVTSPAQIDGDALSDQQLFPQHECGLFGVFGHPNAAVLTYYGLFALQHRGQESAGIVTSNGPGTTFATHKDMGLVSQVFGQTELESLNILISHRVDGLLIAPADPRSKALPKKR